MSASDFTISDFSRISLILEHTNRLPFQSSGALIQKEREHGVSCRSCVPPLDVFLNQKNTTHFGVLHVEAQFPEGGQYLGHNVDAQRNGMGNCHISTHPKLHTQLAGDNSASALQDREADKLTSEMNQRMSRLLVRAHQAVNALLCKQNIPGYDVRWEKDTPNLKSINIAEQDGEKRNITIEFENIDSDPIPEGMRVLISGKETVRIKGDAGPAAIFLGAEQFAKIFKRYTDCPKEAAEAPEEVFWISLKAPDGVFLRHG